MTFLTRLSAIPFRHNHLDDLQFSDKYEFSPSKIVRHHCSRHRHLLARQDELTNPNQAHHVVPPHVLQRPRQSELHEALLVLHSAA